MSEYVPTIGLEIHAELKTQTKMFCRSKNDPDAAEPNSNICPVCMAHPGTLPVINKEAVRHVLRVGVALGSQFADYTEFDRKSYFYPDLPKGYQISQYEHPLVTGGELHGVAITRVHLEEDTASSMHPDTTALRAGYGAGNEATTLVDYNRAGVPLMELVTEPVITSAEEAGEFARELQLLLRSLGASEANMEKGEMRVEANVSVTKTSVEGGTASGGKILGTKVEIKNLNSFNAMERAIRYETKRQIEILERGEKVIQQTLGWDEGKQATFPQRTKEGSSDYRYFPDPDLPQLVLSEFPQFDRELLKASLPELPREQREKYAALGVKPEDAATFARDRRYGDLFDALAKLVPAEDAILASNYIANDLIKIIRDIEERDTKTIDILPISPEQLAKLIGMISARKISSRTAKDILRATVIEGADPEAYARAHNLLQESDSAALQGVVRTIIDANPGVVADFRAGKAAALEYLIGQCMKELRGAGDPAVLRKMLRTNI
ncbi:MAG TPA: Asp-tRNA(Asn)/Glu-tRNA(Gln) amidotransferase subunit GatB [Candidatus Paceibacterota bacterium]